MFKCFYANARYFKWSIAGSILIVLATWYQVDLDKQINEWFGDFYNSIQNLLTTPYAISEGEFFKKCFTFARIAAIYIVVAVLLDFFARHYVFAWRSAMNEYYTKYWDKLRHIEGASQRVQEDTMRFASLLEKLAVRFLDSFMTLIVFLPLLWGLSEGITIYPILGDVPHGLVYISIVFAIVGTALLAIVGIKLPGLEFNNQKVEAAFRKELVYGEDHADRAAPPTLQELFKAVRKNYFRLYFHYMYFDLAKWSYLQFSVIVPYLALAPTLVAGAITLGLMQQILRAFTRVQGSFQFFVTSWTLVVEILSVYKRLRTFEHQLKEQ